MEDAEEEEGWSTDMVIGEGRKECVHGGCGGECETETIFWLYFGREEGRNIMIVMSSGK